MNIKFLITIVLLFCSSSLKSQTFLDDSIEVNKINHIIIENESNKKRIEILDSVISELKEQKKDQEKIIAQKDTIIEGNREKYKHNEDVLKKGIKRRDNIIKVGSGILIILGIIMLL